MTENTGTITISAFSRLGDAAEPVGTVGRVVDGAEMRIVDPETLEDEPTGTAGEIWVRSPHRARGYWRRPEETAKTFLPDGWLRTGDVGVFDEDGHLFIRDRIKDMIITGGENVYSIEVENVLMSHPEVVEVAVYGVPHERWGETVKAVVAAEPGSRLTERALIDFTREHLAHYKCPTVVEFTGALPKSGNGKILKHELRNRDRAAAA
jgi:acyl-CoA synthetase (AMP-forming)/AMP-acid ligase II